MTRRGSDTRSLVKPPKAGSGVGTFRRAIEFVAVATADRRYATISLTKTKGGFPSCACFLRFS